MIHFLFRVTLKVLSWPWRRGTDPIWVEGVGRTRSLPVLLGSAAAHRADPAQEG